MKLSGHCLGLYIINLIVTNWTHKNLTYVQLFKILLHTPTPQPGPSRRWEILCSRAMKPEALDSDSWHSQDKGWSSTLSSTKPPITTTALHKKDCKFVSGETAHYKRSYVTKILTFRALHNFRAWLVPVTSFSSKAHLKYSKYRRKFKKTHLLYYQRDTLLLHPWNKNILLKITKEQWTQKRVPGN